ncbi:MAG: signal peptidase II [Lachnospiraceae bacterium]|nr:signal peptidase II [Lachnospiraceae bacterium]
MNKKNIFISYVKFSLIYIVFCLLLIGLDQVTKELAVQYLKGNEDISVIPKVFSLSYVENHGAAFGILEGRQWLLIGVSFFFLALVLLFALHIFRICQESRRENLSAAKYVFLILCMAFITSGAIGNLIDRVRQGYVVDFLYLLTKNIPFLSFDFPVFNIADCYVTIAAFSVILAGLFLFKEEELNKIFTFRDLKENNKS